MPRIAYKEVNFRADSLRIIEQAVEIASDYEAQGYDLTLRQLYYQFVARDLIPNTTESYKRLGSIVNDARLAGEMDWNFITDRTRNLESLAHWDDPGDVIMAAMQSYRNDLWGNQATRVEIWVEKEALAGVVARAAEALDCAYFACRGYVSQSEMWATGQRFIEYGNRGQQVVILHLGDHDPSGIDMTRDIRDRLEMFTAGEVDLEIRRIALNMDQVQQYQPPPNPAKITDSRAAGYIDRFGRESWELDALDPATLDALIRDHIEREVDDVVMAADRESQEEGRNQLTTVSRRWDRVVSLINDEPEEDEDG